MEERGLCHVIKKGKVKGYNLMLIDKTINLAVRLRAKLSHLSSSWSFYEIHDIAKP